MVERKTRLKETREDVYRDTIAGELDATGLGFQEFSQRVDERRDEMGGALDDIGAGLMVLDEAEPAPASGPTRRVETDPDDLFNARRVHERRSELAQGRDEATTAERVTGDFEQWASAPDQFDFPGIDTFDVQPDF